MFILDTNVVSEVLKANVSPRVERWLQSQQSELVWTTTIVEAELLSGVALLPDGKRKMDLVEKIASVIEIFGPRVLPFDRLAAACYGEIIAARKTAGRPIQTLDAQIAAIAKSRNAVIVTRNTTDFEFINARLINPWA